MNIFYQFIFLLSTFFVIAQSVSPIFSPSDKYVKTGVFEVTSSQFLTDNITNAYNVTLPDCAFSSTVYTIGMGLHSLDIKFKALQILFDILVSSTSASGFQINFSTTMGNSISILKVCYVIKNPSYTDLFYIQTYRFTGGSFFVTNSSPYTQQISLTTPFPASSLGSINERTFLYSFIFESKDTGIQNNIDIYPSTTIIDQGTIQLSLQTLYDDVKVSFYAVSIVLYDDFQITSSGLSRFTLAYTDSSVTDADLFIDTTPLEMFSYNTYLGLKAFHARTLQTPNFLNFQTSFPSNTSVRFQSTNNINWKYMKFEILVIEAISCPPSSPYFIYYLSDCQATIPAGYVQNCQGDFLIDFQMNLNYIVKKPDVNQVQIMYSLEPSDPSLSNMLSQVNWNNALTINVPGTKNIEYISSPRPQLKITVNYLQDLESLQKSITISAYDPAIYPANFAGWKQQTVTLKMSSSNNLAVNFYDDKIYNASKGFNYVFLILSCIYMLFFCLGMIVGKVYILEMTFVPQITFLSLVSLEKITPTISSMSFLRYLFGYWYSEDNGTVYAQEGWNYMKLMGISDDFLLNYNIMFIFIIITLTLGIVFHFTKKPRAKRFFLLDTPLYLVLWFGVWILFTGQIQIRALVIKENDSALAICGIIFFLLCLILFLAYFGLYFKKINKIQSFYSIFSSKTQQKRQEESSNWEQKCKYFYAILFLQRIIMASLFAHAFIFNYLNLIIIAVHIAVIILIIIFRPYKLKIRTIENKQFSPFRCNIRQLLNYSILIIILVFLFITNQIQQSQFQLYIPVIVIILLVVNIIITVFFLIYDQKLQQDFQEIKKLFDTQEDKPNKYQQKPSQTDRKIKQDHGMVGFIDDPSPKDTLIYKNHDFGQSFSFSISPLKKSHQVKLNELRNQRNQFDIDKIAQKNQQIYRKRMNQSQNDNQYFPQQISKMKNHNQIMKGSTPKKSLSYQKHSNYF